MVLVLVLVSSVGVVGVADVVGCVGVVDVDIGNCGVVVGMSGCVVVV